MKKLIALACLGLAVSVSVPVFAGAQQDKMRGCNKEAKADGLKGDERKAFMKKCLSKDYILKGDAAATVKPEASAAAPVAAAKQQDKMKACNADAKARELKGDERKTFMKACLKG
ncbi:MAG: PsiF repeat-containing protein [Gallionellales bacterium RIFOXYD2_FULL_52_7]|nr:MAG: PsiF repeat-containing protein [Gallionellales bacterium RIFOXYD2_FULL_52_7]